MIGLSAIGAMLRGAIGRVPRPVCYAGLAMLALLLLWRWHGSKVDAAFVAGGAAQASIDRQRFTRAAAAAEQAQRAIKRSLVARQEIVSKGTDDALMAKNADLARRYDDLRLRWAAYRADQGGAGADRAIAIPGAAANADAAACPAAGWVSFDIAAAAAEAADTAIARDDAWRSWVAAQAAAWPKD